MNSLDAVVYYVLYKCIYTHKHTNSCVFTLMMLLEKSFLDAKLMRHIVWVFLCVEVSGEYIPENFIAGKVPLVQAQVGAAHNVFTIELEPRL